MRLAPPDPIPLRPPSSGDAFFPRSRKPAFAPAAALTLLALLLATPARATATDGATPGELVVDVAVEGDAYRVRAEFHVDAPTPVAWEVLTDYANIPKFVSSMRSSVVERTEAGLRVRQEAVASLFPFRRVVRLSLDITERSLRDIAFRDVLARDFVSYAGAWELFPDSAGTLVRYSLSADPRASLPKMLGRSMMSRSARDLLEQVRDEMRRRAIANLTPAPAPAGHSSAVPSTLESSGRVALWVSARDPRSAASDSGPLAPPE